MSMLASMPDGPSPVPAVHMMEGENLVSMHTPWHTREGPTHALDRHPVIINKI